MTKRKQGDERTTRQGARTYLTSGLLRCGSGGGPLSVRSAKPQGNQSAAEQPRALARPQGSWGRRRPVPERHYDRARPRNPLAVHVTADDDPKEDGPNRFEVVGTVDLVALAAGAASGSSGGSIRALYTSVTVALEVRLVHAMRQR